MTIADGERYKRHIMSLHAMKFLGIVFMIMIHIFFWLISTEDEAISQEAMPYVKWISRFIYLGYFPMSLPMIAGAMYRVQLDENYGVRNRSLLQISGVSLLLIVLGYAMNALTWGVAYLFDWDVLGLIGIVYLFIFLLRRISKYLLYGVALFALVFEKSIYKLISELPPDIQKLYVVNIFVSINTADFFWPFIPWFAVVVFGYFMYDLLLSPRIQEGRRTEIFYGAIITILLSFSIATSLGQWKFNPSELWGAWLFHLELNTLLIMMCIFAACSSLCFLIYPYIVRLKWLIMPYSVGILWIYIIHTIVGWRLISFLKPSGDPLLLYFPLLLFLLSLSWLIGRGVEYSNTHQFEFIFRRVKNGTS